MAIEYVDLYCIKAALVNKNNPSTNYHGAAEYLIAGQGESNYNNDLLLAFEQLSGVYRYRNVYGVTFFVTADRNISTSNSLFFDSLDSDFDAATVTWDTKPYHAKHFYNGASVSSGSGDVTASVSAYIQNSTTAETTTHVLSAPGFSMDAVNSVRVDQYLKVYTDAAASGKKPYLQVAVSDTPGNVKVTKTAPSTSENFNCAEPCTFSWSINFLNEGGTGYTRPLADIEQTSATIYWREVGSENWNEIAVSGDVRSVTVPANTFPGRDIQWRVTPVVVEYTVYGAGESSYQTARPRVYSDSAATGISGVSTLSPDDTIPWTGSFNAYTADWTVGSDNYKNLLAMFSSLPIEYKYKAIERAGIACASLIGAGDQDGIDLFFLENSFDSNSVTWNTKPVAGKKRGGYSYDNSSGDRVVSLYPFVAAINSESGTFYTTVKQLSQYGLDCLNAPAFMLQAMALEYNADMGRRSGSFYIKEPLVRRAILIDQTVTSKPQAAKYASGYVNRHEAQIFAWDLVPDGDYYCFGEWTQASAVFSYRAGTSGSWTTVSVSGSTQAVEIAANTLAAGTVQWKVQTTDDQGTTAESEVYTIDTTDASTTATPVFPINTIENGDAAILFKWDTANDNGTTPTGADLQYSTDGSSWSTLGSVSGSATQYSAAANTFASGTVYWRVRAYNADSVAGSWSDPVAFVCMAAPPMPVVSATEVPFATISWQSDGQQAYKVTVDGKSYGPYFGTKKSFALPDYLTDGQHTATVEVQSSAGLWSNPGSVTFSVTNVPGDAVSLRGRFDRDAALSWTTDSATADFYVYRDEVRIGHTTATRFTDRFVLGSHSYYVINKLPGGFYTRSNLATGTMRSCTRAVSAFAGGGWLEMALSDDSDTEENFAWSMVVNERHVTGSDLPVVEKSRYTDGSGSYRISFADVESGAAFEALRGQKVIVKSRGGNVVIGVLSGYQKTMTNFFLTYIFTVRRCDWRDYVDDALG